MVLWVDKYRPGTLEKLELHAKTNQQLSKMVIERSKEPATDACWLGECWLGKRWLVECGLGDHNGKMPG